jgi:hypothetical protein
LEIEDHVEQHATMGGVQSVMVAPTEVRFTLHDITKPEAEAVIAIVNQMRGRVPEPAALPSGGRFANLDFE